jgi:demethylmenaquinone methyltransferase/2-methoxy-6-polyprenyl-1,4-benzoquinol methylase
MFTRIAHRYDFMNRVMTLGQDITWRREVVHRANIQPHGYLLDLGTGTGDLACEALRQQPNCYPIAADFTLEMMRVGMIRQGQSRLSWSAADALKLPFPDQTFDAVISGFLLRNVHDIRQSLGEQYRVLKSGGRIVCLDTTQPNRHLLSPLIDLHLHSIIPALGGLLAGEPEAYTYLPESTEQFLPAEQLAERMLSIGFHQVGFQRLMIGTVAIHWGTK